MTFGDATKHLFLFISTYSLFNIYLDRESGTLFCYILLLISFFISFIICVIYDAGPLSILMLVRRHPWCWSSVNFDAGNLIGIPQTGMFTVSSQFTNLILTPVKKPLLWAFFHFEIFINNISEIIFFIGCNILSLSFQTTYLI